MYLDDFVSRFGSKNLFFRKYNFPSMTIESIFTYF